MHNETTFNSNTGERLDDTYQVIYLWECQRDGIQVHSSMNASGTALPPAGRLGRQPAEVKVKVRSPPTEESLLSLKESAMSLLNSWSLHGGRQHIEPAKLQPATWFLPSHGGSCANHRFTLKARWRFEHAAQRGSTNWRLPDCAAQTTSSADLKWKVRYAAWSETRAKWRLVLGQNLGIVHSSEHDGKGGEGVEQTEAGMSESKLELKAFWLEICFRIEQNAIFLVRSYVLFGRVVEMKVSKFASQLLWLIFTFYRIVRIIWKCCSNHVWKFFCCPNSLLVLSSAQINLPGSHSTFCTFVFAKLTNCTMGKIHKTT